MKIDDLVPGMEVRSINDESYFFVGKIDSHPLHPQLRLVIWFSDEGEWFHDALSGMMDISIVGHIMSTDPDILRANLIRSLRSSQSSDHRSASNRPKKKHWG